MLTPILHVWYHHILHSRLYFHLPLAWKNMALVIPPSCNTQYSYKCKCIPYTCRQYPGHCTRVRGSWSHVRYCMCDVILDTQITRTWLACKACFHRSQTTSMEVYHSNHSGHNMSVCLQLACKHGVQALVLEIHSCLRLLQFVSYGTQGSVDESEKESDKTFCEWLCPGKMESAFFSQK